VESVALVEFINLRKMREDMSFKIQVQEAVFSRSAGITELIIYSEMDSAA
jgi:hypothetical protein